MFCHLLSEDRRCVFFAIVLFLSVAPLSFVTAQSSGRSAVQSSPLAGKRSNAQASSEGDADVRAAYLQSLSDEKVKFDDFKTIFNWLTKTSGKEKWRKVQWRHDLWDARIESAKSGKPIFIWAMNGDPLGCV